MLTAKYTPAINRLYLNEIYTVGWQFSIMSRISLGMYQQIHSWATCKDFINDLLWSQFSKKPVDLYGFVYNPSKDVKVDLSTLRIATRNKQIPNDKFECMAENALQVLRYFDKKANVKPCRMRKLTSEVSHSDNKFSTFLFEADSRWMKAPPLVSFYTMIMRMGFWYDPKSNITPEAFLKSVERDECGDTEDVLIIQKCVSSGIFDLLTSHGPKVFGRVMAKNYDFAKNTNIKDIHNFGVRTWSNYPSGMPTHYPKTIISTTDAKKKFST